MKRITSLLMALIMISALATTAFATGNGDETVVNNSITVKSAKPGETYSLYKLFDLTVNSQTAPTAYSYKVNSGWAAFFAAAQGETPAGDGNKYVTINDAGYVTEIKDENGQPVGPDGAATALAKAAAAWESKPSAEETIPATGTSVVFSNLENGYWLITSTLGTFAMTDTTPSDSDVEVNEKNPEDTITKQVKEDSRENTDNAWGDSNDAQIGDTVEFKSELTLVKGTCNVVIHDTMTSGLTLKPESIKINGLTENTDYTVNCTHTDGCTFEVTILDTYLKNLTADQIKLTLTYSAVLNENAVTTTTTTTGEDGSSTSTVTPSLNEQTNTTHVSFGNATTSQADTTTTKTYNFKVFKYDAENADEHLADAVFSLKKDGAVVSLVKIDDNNYRVALNTDTTTVNTFTTVENGDIVIWGVDSDSDYSLVEVTPPNGYNALSGPVSVTVKSDSVTRAEIENNTGDELPSTGGMGTTLFYTLGGLLAAAAVILLVTKKRMTSAM